MDSVKPLVVTESKQAQLYRNIVMSHAVGVGPALEPSAVRAIMTAAIIIGVGCAEVLVLQRDRCGAAA